MKLSQLPITPIVTVIVGKILGIIFSIVVFSINVQINELFSLFKLMLSSDSYEELILISSYSDLVMFTIISTGLVVSLFGEVHKDSHRLDKKDLDSYFSNGIKSSLFVARKLYNQALYWMMFLIISNFYILYNTITGKTYLWIYLVTLFLTISLIFYFYFDFKKEIHLAKNKLFKNEL